MVVLLYTQTRTQLVITSYKNDHDALLNNHFLVILKFIIINKMGSNQSIDIAKRNISNQQQNLLQAEGFDHRIKLIFRAPSIEKLPTDPSMMTIDYINKLNVSCNEENMEKSKDDKLAKHSTIAETSEQTTAKSNMENFSQTLNQEMETHNDDQCTEAAIQTEEVFLMQLSQAIPYVESSVFQTQESADYLTEDIYDRKLTQGIPFKTSMWKKIKNRLQK